MTPPLPSRIHKISHIKDIDENPVKYKVVDEIIFPSNSNKRKTFAIHRLRYLGENSSVEDEIRIGYYMISHKGRMKGKWAWGQYSPFMTSEEMEKIFREAVEKEWIKS